MLIYLFTIVSLQCCLMFIYSCHSCFISKASCCIVQSAFLGIVSLVCDPEKIRSKIWTWKKQGAKNQGHCYSKREEAAWPHGMCYSHFGNEVCNGAISITQRGFINDCYKVNPIGQWGKILVMAMGFVDHLGPGLFSFWVTMTLFLRIKALCYITSLPFYRELQSVDWKHQISFVQYLKVYYSGFKKTLASEKWKTSF